MILIQMYSGWRPRELITLELDNVNLEEWYFQAGMKTDAGRDRIVPIHSKIQNLVRKNYEFAQSIGSNYLFNDIHSMRSPELTYDKYANRFKKVIDMLNLNSEHRAHDPRITFVTLAKRAQVDEYVIKLLVGHRIEDITEKVYTVRDLEC